MERRIYMMMKKNLFFMMILFSLWLSQGVSFGAPSGPYMGGHLGMTFLLDSDNYENSEIKMELDFDPGFNLGLIGGYQWKMFRLEGEVQYQENGIDSFNVCWGRTCVSDISSSGDVTMFSFLTNVYLDFVNQTAWTPYITAGIGFSSVEVNDFEVARLEIGDSSDSAFAYQIGAGISYSINEKFIIDLKYRYHDIAELDFDGIKIDFANHDAYVGLRYCF